MELWQMSAVELARTIRVGQASSREAVQSVLGRMDAVNPKLNAVVRRMDDEARPEGVGIIQKIWDQPPALCHPQERVEPGSDHLRSQTAEEVASRS